MSNSIKDKAIKGVSWSFLDNIANQGITFIVGLILARLLTPEEYGIIGIILVFITLFNGIVDCGLSSAIIRKSNPNNKDYNTVFYSSLVLSVVMYILLYSLSPYIAVFFNQPILVKLLRVMGVILIINALAVIHRAILVIDVDFKSQTEISLLASIVSGLLGIMAAVNGYGVWSLIVQQFMRQFLNTLFLWIWCKWRPTLLFSIDSFKELFGFGWKLMLSNMINSIWNEVYQIIIGKYYSPATLGQYTRAKQFNDIFSSNLTIVFQRVTYPLLSSIKNDLDRLKNSYKRIIRLIVLVTSILLLGLAGCSESVILLLLGNQWKEAITYLPILCFNGIFYPLSAINLNMLMVQGKSGLYLKLEIVKKCLAIIPIVVGIVFNIYWMLWSSVIYGIIAYFINAYYSGREIHYTLLEQIKDISPSIFLALTMYFILVFINRINIGPLIMLTIQLSAAACFVIGVLHFSNNTDYLELKSILLYKLKRK